MTTGDDAREGAQRNGLHVASAPRPTLKTIAAIAGLAVTTVSRALAGDVKIALETRNRVSRIAAEIGYQPDRAAQRLRTGRTNIITLILDPHEEILGYGTSLIKGMTGALRNTPYHLVITPHFADTPDTDPVCHILRNHLADGVVFSRTRMQDERVRLLLEHDFPFICHGRTAIAEPHPFVDYDNEGFVRQAVAKLAASGSRRPCIILPPPHFTFAGHLHHGFTGAVSEHGLTGEILAGVTLDNTSGEIQQRVAQRLDEASPPDGFICGGEVSALAVIAALSDRGLVPGKDIGVVAKQTSGLFDVARPRIPTIQEDLCEAGAQMAQLLLKRIAGAPVQSLQYLQPAPGFQAARL